jgi:hypothetical protein
VRGKTSSRDVKTNTLKKFVQVIENLRPNVATLAVMEERNSNLEAATAGLRSRLQAAGVNWQLLTLESGDLDTNTLLP